jgi:hypothetical protein
MIKAGTVVLLAALAISLVERADGAGQSNVAAIQGVTSELQACLAYDTVMARCSIEPRTGSYNGGFANPGLPESLGRSLAASLGLSSRTYNTQNRLLLAVMLGAIHNSCANRSVLTTRFGPFCKRLEQNVDVRFQEWVKCAENGHTDCGGPDLP